MRESSSAAPERVVAEGWKRGGDLAYPIYFVCDESASMWGAPIEAVNAGLAKVFREIASDPFVEERVWIGVIAFHNVAEVLVPLSRVADVATIPSCPAGGGTSYRAAFVKVKEQIAEDVPRLRSMGHAVGRPIVFFMSCGVPNHENWQEAHAALIDRDARVNPFRPHIISFGVADAKQEGIRAVATDLDKAGGLRLAYMAQEGISPGSAIAEIMKFITYAVATRRPAVITPIPESSGLMLIDP